MTDTERSEQHLPLAEETATVRQRTVETGRVRVRTVVEEHERWVRETLTRDEVIVERIPLGREIHARPAIRQEGDTLVIPVVEEVLVLEKKLVLKEEVHLRRQRRHETVAEPVQLKSTRAVVEREPAGASDATHDPDEGKEAP